MPVRKNNWLWTHDMLACSPLLCNRESFYWWYFSSFSPFNTQVLEQMDASQKKQLITGSLNSIWFSALPHWIIVWLLCFLPKWQCLKVVVTTSHQTWCYNAHINQLPMIHLWEKIQQKKFKWVDASNDSSAIVHATILMVLLFQSCMFCFFYLMFILYIISFSYLGSYEKGHFGSYDSSWKCKKDDFNICIRHHENNDLDCKWGRIVFFDH